MIKALIKQPESDEEFKQYFNFRWRLLRKPWNEPEGSEKDEIEDQCFHVMLCDENNQCVGIGRLQLNSETEAQIRYMAVAKEKERKGLGRKIITAFENNAKENNITSIILDAREPAVGFYEKLGYVKKEKTYLLFNSIQHYRMEKKLMTNKNG